MRTRRALSHRLPAHELGAAKSQVDLIFLSLFDKTGVALAPAGGEQSITNIGTRPTFTDREFGIETHLLASPPQSSGAGNPAEIEVFFHYRLRDEKKFDSPSTLLAQIHSDIERAHGYFRGTGKPQPEPPS